MGRGVPGRAAQRGRDAVPEGRQHLSPQLGEFGARRAALAHSGHPNTHRWAPHSMTRITRRATSSRLGAVVGGRRTDLAIGIVLTAVAVAIRQFTLPRDGLGNDDGWVFVGATKAGLDDLLSVSLTHPGFTAILSAWANGVTDRTDWAAVPVFVVGVAAPALVYLGLRWCGVGRPAALIAGAMTTVAPAHIVFSGRVKPYVIETSAVFALGLLVHRLHRSDWTWRTTALWVGGAVALASLSSFILVASAIAVLLMALYARDDRPQRLVAVAAQGVLQLALLLVTRSHYDSAGLTDWWMDPPSKGKVELYANPIDMGREIGSHLRHLGGTAVQGGAAPAFIVSVLAIIGLVVWSRPGRPLAAVAQFFGLLVMVAFVGGVLDVMPFGARVEVVGTRASLWLLPSLVVGVALLAQSAVDWVTRVRPRIDPALLGVVMVLSAVLIASGSGVRAPAKSVELGTRSAAAFVEDMTEPGDATIVFPLGWFSHSAEPGVEVTIRPDTSELTGYLPEPVDPRMWVFDWDDTREQVERRVGGAPRVVIHDAPAAFGDAKLPDLLVALESLGYEETRREMFGVVLVIVLDRVAGAGQ